MRQNWNGIRGSVTAKILVLATLVLLLLVPLKMTGTLIAGRSAASARAGDEIAASWGAAQTIGGPILIVPFGYSVRDRQGVTRRVHDELYLLPLELTIEGGAGTQVLRRGIYRIPVYSAPLSVTGTLRPVVLDPAVYPDADIQWQAAGIALPLSDPTALRETVTLTLGQDRIDFGPATDAASLGPWLVAPLASIDPERFAGEQEFSIELALAGTGQLRFRPDGDVTRVTLRSDWPSPSFGGDYLPERREVTAEGFVADWRVLSLGRGYPATWLGSGHDGPGQGSAAGPYQLRGIERVASGSFGVEFLVPVDVHTSSRRAIRYAELYLAVTFTAFFLFEVFARIRLHPIQYLTVGFANAIFYLLLLALAEHAGFTRAYVASAIASTGLISAYAAAALGSTLRAAPVAALLTGLYCYLYSALRAEDYALVIGALGLFVLLSAFMYLTRRIDWYAIELGTPTGSRTGENQEQARPA